MKNYKLKINGNPYDVNIKSVEDNIVELEVNGSPFRVEMEKEVKTTKTPKLFRAEPRPSQNVNSLKSENISKKVTAPLPGVILEVSKKEGDEVKTGDKLAVLEAMKMENNIMADSAGKIKKLHIKPGDSVLQGDVLIEIE